MRTAVWERIWWVYTSQRCVWLAKLVIVLGGFRWAKFAKVSLVRSRRNHHHLSVRIRENPSNQSIIWLRDCPKRTLISLLPALQCKPPPLPTEAAAPKRLPASRSWVQAGGARADVAAPVLLETSSGELHVRGLLQLNLT